MRGARGWAILTAVGLLASTGLLVAPTGVANAAAKPPVTSRESAELITPAAKGAKLTVTAANPAADNKTVVSFDFAPKDTYKNRWVSVQYLSPTTSTWKSVKVLKMSSAGKGTVKVASSYAKHTFRAVAFTAPGKPYPLVASPSKAAATYWKQEFSEEFNKSWATTGTFASRGVGARAGYRICSTPSDKNVSVSSGKLNLKFKKISPLAADKTAIEDVLKETKSAAVAKAKQAVAAAKANAKQLSKAKKNAAIAAAEKKLKAANKLPTKVAQGCPKGVFTNAMVGTQGSFTIPKGASGVVRARVKFPKAKGMHGAVWLQSNTSHEIDIFESFGLGAGVASYVHIPGSKKLGGYVGGSAVKKASWFSKWHTVSVEYDSSKVVYRLDGKVTKTIKKNMTKQEYFLVLSLLSSDWELPRLNKKTTSATMQVDWVKAYIKTKNA